MLQSEFLSEWGIWYVFAGDPSETSENYKDKYKLAFNMKTPSDLAYVWKQTQLSQLDNFFLKEQNVQNSFCVNQKWKRVNSIEYFKKGIEPTWEDPKNQNGGRFIFSVNRTQQNKDEIYTNLVFFLLGEDFEHSERINGFRFISPKNTQSFYRVEIWVDFNNSNLEDLKLFQSILTNLFNNLNYDSKSVRFLNNKTEPQPNKETKQTKQSSK